MNTRTNGRTQTDGLTRGRAGARMNVYTDGQMVVRRRTDGRGVGLVHSRTIRQASLLFQVRIAGCGEMASRSSNNSHGDFIYI